MKCTSCEFVNRPGRAFCSQCGAPMPVICEICGFENERGDKFCGGCGADLQKQAKPGARSGQSQRLPTSGDANGLDKARAGEAERRPLTVMFADLVGSTHLSLQLDPEDLRDLLFLYQHKCTEVIRAYGGFVSQYMGDGIMAYFGYPEAHEDDAERAIHAGLEIVEAMRAIDSEWSGQSDVELQVRVGLAAGLVVVGDLIGEGASQQRAVVGDAPNIAARMQGLAESNSIIIDASVYRLAGSAFATRDLGTMQIKGSAEPVHAWQVLHSQARQDLFETVWSAPLSPLIGREAELAQLQDLWHQAQQGQGQLVVISGDAGIGKTRLAQTAQAQLAGAEKAQFRCLCSQLYSGTAFYPIIEQVERAAGIEDSDDADQKFEKIGAFLQPYAFGDSDGQALLARLLSIPAEGRFELPNLSPAQLKKATISFLVELLAAFARSGPVIGLFEDIHWADPSSLELLDQLAARVAELPLLILCTDRDQRAGRWSDLEQAHVLHLQRLDDSQCQLLVESLLNRVDLDANLKAAISTKADGVPLFIEEIIRSLEIVSDEAATGERSSKAGIDKSLVVPDTLQSSLMSRLDRLGSAKAVAQVGATIGRDFDFKLLADVAALESEDLSEALQSLQRESVIVCQGQPPESTYSFRHALLRDAAYQSQLRRRRKDIHGQIADTLEARYPAYWELSPEILARHLTEAGLNEKAISYWDQAARRATQNAANVEAEGHFNQALALIDQLPSTPARAGQELGLLTGLGAVLINNHGGGSSSVSSLYQRCHDICEELGVAEETSSPENHFATLWGLWLTCENLNVAMDIVEQMRQLGEKMARSDLVMQAHHSGWATLYNTGELDSCLHSIAVGQSLYDADAHRDHASIYGGHDPEVCACGIGGMALCLQGLSDQASARIEQSIAFAEKINHPGSLAHALDFAAQFERICERPENTLARAEALVAFAAKNEFTDYEARGKALRGWARARLGQPEEGLEELRANMLVQRKTGTSEDFSFFLEMLAETACLAGQPEEGFRAIDEALESALRSGAEFWSSAVKRRQAELMVLSDPGLKPQAVTCLREAVSLARQQKARLLELYALLDLAVLIEDPNEFEDLLEAVKGICEISTEGAELAVMVAARDFLERQATQA